MSAYIVERIQVRDAENHTWLGVEADHEDADGEVAYEISMGDSEGSFPYIMHLKPARLADIGMALLELVHGKGNVRVSVQSPVGTLKP